MSALTELIERMKMAEGPDREIDRAIARHLGWTKVDPPKEMDHPMPSLWMDEGGKQCGFGPPAFTASIDAIVSLIEAKLPGWAISHIGEDYSSPPKRTMGWTVEVEEIDGPYFQGHMRTLPLALCLAFLLALASTDRGEG